MKFRVIRGNIAEQEADVLVNAAGTSLRMGSGVAGALRERGGERLNETAIDKGPIELGEVAVTDAFELDAMYVIHAAAMPHFGDGQATAASIQAATRNALAAAEDHDCESIVIPALGCGVAGYDIRAGAEIIIQEVVAYNSTTLTDVRIIGYSEQEYSTIKSIAVEYEEFIDTAC